MVVDEDARAGREAALEQRTVGSFHSQRRGGRMRDRRTRSFNTRMTVDGL